MKRLLFLLVIFVCCWDSLGANDPIQVDGYKHTHHFGKISTETNLVYEIILSTNSSIKIQQIATSCSCVISYVKVGDIIETNKPIKVGINVETSFSFGLVRQQIRITSDRNTDYLIDLDFEWYPKPYSQPGGLVFTKANPARDLTLTFPEDPEVRLLKLGEGAPLLKITKAEYGINAIRLKLLINSNSLSNTYEGKMRFQTTSKKYPLFEVPYLILEK